MSVNILESWSNYWTLVFEWAWCVQFPRGRWGRGYLHHLSGWHCRCCGHHFRSQGKKKTWQKHMVCFAKTVTHPYIHARARKIARPTSWNYQVLLSGYQNVRTPCPITRNDPLSEIKCPLLSSFSALLICYLEVELWAPNERVLDHDGLSAKKCRPAL